MWLLGYILQSVSVIAFTLFSWLMRKWTLTTGHKTSRTNTLFSIQNLKKVFRNLCWICEVIAFSLIILHTFGTRPRIGIHVKLLPLKREKRLCVVWSHIQFSAWLNSPSWLNCGEETVDFSNCKNLKITFYFQFNHYWHRPTTLDLIGPYHCHLIR